MKDNDLTYKNEKAPVLIEKMKKSKKKNDPNVTLSQGEEAV